MGVETHAKHICEKILRLYRSWITVFGFLSYLNISENQKHLSKKKLGKYKMKILNADLINYSRKIVQRRLVLCENITLATPLQFQK